MKNNCKLLCVFLIMSLWLVGCSSKVNKSTTPQYCTSDNSVITEEGYYYLCDNELVFFDIEKQTVDKLCSVPKVKEDYIWLDQDRINMVVENETGMAIVSFDKKGENKKESELPAEINQMISICYFGGYIYYGVPNEQGVTVNRVSTASDSKPEQIKEYKGSENGNFKLDLIPRSNKVYVVYRVKDNSTSVTWGEAIKDKSIMLDYYDTASNNLVTAFENSKLDSEMIPLDENKFIFDDSDNMYFLTKTNDSCIVNKYNIKDKNTEKIYTIQCDNTGVADAQYIDIRSFDGKYIYIHQRVNTNREKDAVKNYTVTCDLSNNKTITTEANTNYIYVIDTAGKCADVISLKAKPLKETVSKQTAIIVVDNFIGDSRMLILDLASNYDILDVNAKTDRLVFDKSQIGKNEHIWKQ